MWIGLLSFITMVASCIFHSDCHFLVFWIGSITWYNQILGIHGIDSIESVYHVTFLFECHSYHVVAQRYLIWFGWIPRQRHSFYENPISVFALLFFFTLSTHETL